MDKQLLLDDETSAKFLPYTKNTLQPWQNADKTCLPPKELVKKN